MAARTSEGNSKSIKQKIKTLFHFAIWTMIVTTPLAAQDAISLVGSGSNLAGPLYSAWTTQFAKLHPNVQVTYLALGTSKSIKEIHDGTGDFGGGEIPLTSAQKNGSKYTLMQFPTVLVAIAPIYKLPGKPDLRFSGEVLAEIYLGTIRNWKDPKIARLNPGIALPDLTITAVHLSGVKGSNYIFTDFLSKTSPEWKSKIGKTASPSWPVGVEINRSEAMVEKVSATPGAIGYVELTYTKRKDIGYGSVRNAAGEFVKPTVAGIVAACAASEKSMPEDMGPSLVNAPGKESYPLVSFTWIYVPSSGLAPARSRALRDFWSWALGSGQEIASGFGYTVLPSSVVLKAQQTVNSIQ
ncbi:MAG TPA: phosphate ABC transporter substrate-binding protein PstS [Terriglobales bacterium]|nr:phosphate ABC transporter substrate-binding protein PstS [Terriglobales bacterium]